MRCSTHDMGPPGVSLGVGPVIDLASLDDFSKALTPDPVGVGVWTIDSDVVPCACPVTWVAAWPRPAQPATARQSNRESSIKITRKQLTSRL